MRKPTLQDLLELEGPTQRLTLCPLCTFGPHCCVGGTSVRPSRSWSPAAALRTFGCPRSRRLRAMLAAVALARSEETGRCPAVWVFAGTQCVCRVYLGHMRLMSCPLSFVLLRAVHSCSLSGCGTVPPGRRAIYIPSCVVLLARTTVTSFPLLYSPLHLKYPPTCLRPALLRA